MGSSARGLFCGDCDRGTKGPGRDGDSPAAFASALALWKKGEFSLPGIAVLILAIHGLVLFGFGEPELELGMIMGLAGRGDFGGESRFASPFAAGISFG